MSLSQRISRVSAHLSPVRNLGRAKRPGLGEAGGEPSSSQGKGTVCPFVGIRAGPPGRLSQAHRRPSHSGSLSPGLPPTAQPQAHTSTCPSPVPTPNSRGRLESGLTSSKMTSLSY